MAKQDKRRSPRKGLGGAEAAESQAAREQSSTAQSEKASGAEAPTQAGFHLGVRGWGGTYALWLGALVPSWLYRSFQLWDYGWGSGAASLRGYFIDGLAASIVGTVTLLGSSRLRSQRAVRGLNLCVGILWVLAHHANYEHLRGIGSALTFSHAQYMADATFFFGSATHLSRPLLLLTALAGTALLLWFSAGRPVGVRKAAAPATAVALTACVSLSWGIGGPAASWRDSHFLLAALGEALSTRPALAASGGRGGVERADLAGDPVGPTSQGHKNVLLLVLEGTGAARLPFIAGLHGREVDAPLHHLDREVRTARVYSNIVSHQRQTNRGLFSLLCGQLPKLVTGAPKMSEFATSSKGKIPCLPRLMRKHGYETVYLQGSGLAFMAKDMFMPMAGFDLVLGRESIPKYYAINTWGVDDRSLFEATLARIDSLQESSKPWFLTVLTVGTHHPGIVPSSFSAGPYPGFFERSVAYLDLALGDLFAGLKQRRIFEDTLVVVTSDETQVTEQDKREEKFRQVLRQAWGLLAMWGPGIEPAVVAEPGAQIDVPLTIMDYLGLEVPGGSIGGRSLLRTYATARDLPFGNAYAKSVAIFNAGNGLTFCNEAFSECKSLKRAEGSMFEGTYTEEAELDADWSRFLRAAALSSMFAYGQKVAALA
jgi:hypothetical protein